METKQVKLPEKEEKKKLDPAIMKVLNIIDELEARVQRLEDWHKKRNEKI